MNKGELLPFSALAPGDAFYFHDPLLHPGHRFVKTGTDTYGLCAEEPAWEAEPGETVWTAGPRRTYTIAPGGQSITCHVCKRTSYSLGDVEHRYCGHCKMFHD